MTEAHLLYPQGKPQLLLRPAEAAEEGRRIILVRIRMLDLCRVLADCLQAESQLLRKLRAESRRGGVTMVKYSEKNLNKFFNMLYRPPLLLPNAFCT